MLVDLYGLPKETRYCVIPVKKMIMRGGSSLYLRKSNIFHSLKNIKGVRVWNCESQEDNSLEDSTTTGRKSICATLHHNIWIYVGAAAVLCELWKPNIVAAVSQSNSLSERENGHIISKDGCLLIIQSLQRKRSIISESLSISGDMSGCGRQGEKDVNEFQPIWIVCPPVLFSSSCLGVSRRVNADTDKRHLKWVWIHNDLLLLFSFIWWELWNI